VTTFVCGETTEKVKLLVTDFTLMSTSACIINFTSGHHMSSVSHLAC